MLNFALQVFWKKKFEILKVKIIYFEDLKNYKKGPKNSENHIVKKKKGKEKLQIRTQILTKFCWNFKIFPIFTSVPPRKLFLFVDRFLVKT